MSSPNVRELARPRMPMARTWSAAGISWSKASVGDSSAAGGAEADDEAEEPECDDVANSFAGTVLLASDSDGGGGGEGVKLAASRGAGG
jgi:hypothetical protein